MADHVAALGVRQIDARQLTVDGHVVVKLVGIVVHHQHIHAHLGHLVDDGLPIGPGVTGSGLRPVGPGENAAHGNARDMPLVERWEVEGFLFIGQHIAGKSEGQSEMFFQQAVHPVQAALGIRAADDVENTIFHADTLQHIALLAWLFRRE
ncbi:MAG: hypothetical protein WCP12_04615 [bacterium]